MAWLELHQTLPTNRKTLRLKKILKIKTPQAVGHLCMLWLWAIDNAQDGDLSGFEPDEIAEVAEWQGKNPKAFMDALIESGFVDENLHLHDWSDYSGRLTEKRKANAERMRNARAKKKETAAVQNENVQGTCDAQDAHVHGLQYSTVPYSTVPYLTKDYFVVDDSARARAEADGLVDDYVVNRNLSMDVYFGMTPDAKMEVTAFTESLFAKFSLRKPTEQDVFRVFERTSESYQVKTDSGDRWKITFPPDKLDLLMYAFEQATVAGCAGNWNYINGVLIKLGQRGIKTLSDAEAYEGDRDFQKYGG